MRPPGSASNLEKCANSLNLSFKGSGTSASTLKNQNTIAQYSLDKNC